MLFSIFYGSVVMYTSDANNHIDAGNAGIIYVGEHEDYLRALSDILATGNQTVFHCRHWRGLEAELYKKI